MQQHSHLFPLLWLVPLKNAVQSFCTPIRPRLGLSTIETSSRAQLRKNDKGNSHVPTGSFNNLQHSYLKWHFVVDEHWFTYQNLWFSKSTLVYQAVASWNNHVLIHLPIIWSNSFPPHAKYVAMEALLDTNNLVIFYDLFLGKSSLHPCVHHMSSGSTPNSSWCSANLHGYRGWLSHLSGLLH